MTSNERVTFTIYPLWMVLLGKLLLYFALVLGPAAAASALTSLLAGTPIHALVGAIVLPLMYAGLYWMLRRSGSRAQNFIWLVVLLFALTAVAQGNRALTVGGWEKWAGSVLGVIYTVGFAVLAVRGWRQNRKDVQNYHAAERQAHRPASRGDPACERLGRTKKRGTLS